MCVLCSYHVTVSVKATTKNAIHKEESSILESRARREREYLCIPARAVTRERERERERAHIISVGFWQRERERGGGDDIQ